MNLRTKHPKKSAISLLNGDFGVDPVLISSVQLGVGKSCQKIINMTEKSASKRSVIIWP